MKRFLKYTIPILALFLLALPTFPGVKIKPVTQDSVTTSHLSDGADVPAEGECLKVAADTDNVEYATCGGGGANSFSTWTDGTTPASADSSTDTLTCNDTASVDCVTANDPETIAFTVLTAGLACGGHISGFLDNATVIDVACSGSCISETEVDDIANLTAGALDALTEIADLCAANEGIFRNTGDSAWECSAPAGSGDVTAVGAGCADGDCLTDGKATSGTTIFVWEGNVADAEQVTFDMSSVEPGSAFTLTFPDETGTFCTTGAVCTGYEPAATLSGIGDCGAGSFARTLNDAAGPSCAVDDDVPEVGDYGSLVGGAGIANTSGTLSTASGDTDFLASGALTCGAATQGKAQVHTTPFQYCDNAATPLLKYAAYGDSTGDSTGVACAGSCISESEVDDIANFTAGALDADPELYTDAKCLYITEPGVEDLDGIYHFMSASIITRVWCETDTGTSTLNIENDDGTPVDILSSDIVCDTDEQTSCASACTVDTIGATEDDVAQFDELNISISANSGTPGKVSICFGFTRND